MSRMLVERGENFKRRRLLLGERDACYHLISRAPFGVRCLKKDGAKNVFVRLLMKQAGFCGVEVLAYCVMSNHIHLLVRVPYREPDSLSDAELLRRYKCLYSGRHVPLSSYTPLEVEDIFKEGGDKATALRRALLSRMGNVSVFMRELKQRFSFWYNAAHDNQGAVWNSRFRSQLIENDTECLAMVAAYIDLNPVRAEIVDDPANYPHSSYGAAVQGNQQAQQGYCKIFCVAAWLDCEEDYETILYGIGSKHKATDLAKPNKDRGVIAEDKVEQKRAKRKKIPLQQAMHSRMRTMSEAGALGRYEFVESVFQANRSQFSEGRLTGSRRIYGISDIPDLTYCVNSGVTELGHSLKENYKAIGLYTACILKGVSMVIELTKLINLIASSYALSV